MKKQKKEEKTKTEQTTSPKILLMSYSLSAEEAWERVKAFFEINNK